MQLMRTFCLLAVSSLLCSTGCTSGGPAPAPTVAEKSESTVAAPAAPPPTQAVSSVSATVVKPQSEPSAADSRVRALVAAYLVADGHGGWRKDEKAATELEKLTADEVASVWKLLADSDANVRRGAAVFLLPLIDPTNSQQVEAFTKLLGDSDRLVRARGIDALRQFSTSDQRRALPHLTALLDPRHEDRPENRAAAVRLIGSLKEAAAEALSGILTAAGTDPDAKVRSAALAAATSISTAVPVIDTLGKALADSDESVRLAAASRLRQLGSSATPAAAALAGALGDQSSDISEAAAEALIRIGAPAVEPLAAQLTSAKPQAKKLALAALIRIGPAAKTAVKAIEKCQADPDPQVKQLAETALKRLTASK
jgi:hypothetical protein